MSTWSITGFAAVLTDVSSYRVRHMIDSRKLGLSMVQKDGAMKKAKNSLFAVGYLTAAAKMITRQQGVHLRLKRSVAGELCDNLHIYVCSDCTL